MSAHSIFHRKVAARVDFIVFAGVLLLFFLIKIRTLEATTGDHGFYVYAGRLWSLGILPYRDFFFSHPPLHILPLALMMKLFGMHPTFLSPLLPSIAGAFSGMIVFILGRKFLGRFEGALGATFFLLSFGNLSRSSALTGINLSLFFLLLGILFSMRKKPLLAGVAFGLGISTGLYVIVGTIVMLIIIILEQRQNMWKFLGGLVVTLGVIHLPFLLLVGKPYIEQIVLYQLQSKGAESVFFARKSAIILEELKHHIFLFSMMTLGIFFFTKDYLLWQRNVITLSLERIRLLRIALFMVGGYILFFALLGTLFPHYLLLPLPFIALLASDACHRLLSFRRPVIFVSLLSGFILLSITFSLREYYMSFKERKLAIAEDIGQALNESLEMKGTIYGDFGIVPTISLVGGPRIAAHEIESSVMRFEADPTAMKEVIRKIEGDNVRAILLRPKRGLSLYPPFQQYLRSRYRLAHVFHDAETGLEVEMWMPM